MGVGEAVEAVRDGLPVIIPTDTVYGLCASCYREAPVERLRRYVDDLRRAARAADDQQLLHYATARERLAMVVAEDARRQKEAAGGTVGGGGGGHGGPHRRGVGRSKPASTRLFVQTILDWVE